MSAPINSPVDLRSASPVYKNLSPEELIKHALANGEAELSDKKALVATTGKYKGRTPKDKAIVCTPTTENDIWWEINARMTPEVFAGLRLKAQNSIKDRRLYVVDAYGGADPKYQIKVRFIVEQAWHALFVRNLLIRPTAEQLATFEPEWTIVDLGKVLCDPAVDKTRSEASIALNFDEKMVLIFGTQYAGEMKKSVFTIMNYLLPKQGVMSMHCSANVGKDQKVALFFGLSGTGKTTLSADHDRFLIGDDEHGWSDEGVFNIEGGCYAKCINLSPKNEPEIYNAIKYGSVLENVILDENKVPDYTNTKLTENTRCAYPINFIPGALEPSKAGHPSHVMFLTCDALGVLPPISKLTPDQAMFHFLNGYTAKVAGTEDGITEPELTFSTCFGQPFLPLHPTVYAELLKKKLEEHKAVVWLVNTGWTGGRYGVGHRMSLPNTRTLIRAAMAGELDGVEFKIDPIFGLAVPQSCPGVPAEILNPRATWEKKEDYDIEAQKLKLEFDTNFKKFAATPVLR